MKNKPFYTAIVALALTASHAWSTPPRFMAKIEGKTHSETPVLHEYQPPFGYKATQSPAQNPASRTDDTEATQPEMMDALWGGFVNSSTVTYTGMWAIPFKENSTMMLQVSDNNLYPNAGGVLAGDTYFAFRYYGDLTADTSVKLYGFNTNGNFDTNSFWSSDYGYTSRGADWVATDMALNPDDNLVYGCFHNATLDGFELACIEGLEFYNSFNATRNTIATLDMPLCAVGFSADGEMYGITFMGDLVQVDTEDGKYTLVGDTGIDPYYYTGGTIHDGKFYYLHASPQSDTALYEIDLTTAAATKKASAEGIQILKGLFVKSSEVKKGPKTPSNVRTEFEGVSTTGKVIFDVPALTQGEETGSGELTYVIEEYSNVLASGTTAYGQTDVIAEIDLATEGSHYITITLADTDGNTSPQASTSLNIGYGDSPDEVKNVLAYYQDGVFHAKWDPVTTGNYGSKPLDPSKVTYRARLYQGNTQVPYIETYKGAGTSCKIEYEVKSDKAATYIIRVDVSVSGSFSNWGYSTSNKIFTGGADLPYTNDFTRYDSVDNLCVWDNNGDGKTFTWFSNAGGEARMQANWNDSEIAEDDWLIFPGVNLTAGKYYKFSMDYYTIESNPERFGVFMGKQANPHALTTAVIPEETREQIDRASISGGFVAQESGVFFFGIHAASDPESYWLTIDNVKIVDGGSGSAPQAPGALTIEPDKTGALAAKVTCSAPVALLDGTENTTDAYDKIELYRGGQLVGTQTDVAPGSAITFDVTVDADAYYTFAAVASNAAGAGLAAEATRFIGVNRPVSPDDVFASEDPDTPGKITLTWNPVTTDIDGYEIDPDNVTYTIANYTGTETYHTGIQGTTATFQATAKDEQRFDLFTVRASTRTGDSEYLGYAQMMPVGKPDHMPYFLSFDSEDTQNTHIFTSMAHSGGTKIQLGATTPDFSVDGNGNGTYLVYSGDTKGDVIDLITGKITIDPAAKKPRLVYYLFNIADDNENSMTAIVNNKAVQTVVLKTLPVGRWSRVTLDLTPYKGTDISIRFRGAMYNYQYNIFDGIEILDLPDNDIAMIALDSPENVNPGTPFKITATIQNKGINDASGATLQILHNDQLLNETDPFNLAGGEMMRVNLPQTLSLLDDNTHTYIFSIKWIPDQTPANDQATATVVLNLPQYPTVQLEGTLDDNQHAVLTWQKPDPMPAAPESLTDDFEAYDPFTFGNVGKWTMVDRDNAPVGSLIFTVPGMTPGETATSFVHFDITKISGFDFTGFDSCSGNAFICSIFTDGLTRRDDWAISPLLSGDAQTIKFMARSMAGNEAFQVLYSTTGTDPDDFILLKQETLVPAQWKEYVYELPEAAIHFAIRDNSNYADILYVDDVTYAPGQRPEIIGYNIYRDGVLITTEPIQERTYTDTDNPVDGLHTYAVTVVYGEGESAASNTVILATSALCNIDAGTRPATWYTISGIRLPAEPCAPGLYIRVQGSTAHKILK